VGEYSGSVRGEEGGGGGGGGAFVLPQLQGGREQSKTQIAGGGEAGITVKVLTGITGSRKLQLRDRRLVEEETGLLIGKSSLWLGGGIQFFALQTFFLNLFLGTISLASEE